LTTKNDRCILSSTSNRLRPVPGRQGCRSYTDRLKSTPVNRQRKENIMRKLETQLPFSLPTGETFSSISSLMDFTPYYSSFSGQAGSREDGVIVKLLLTHGKTTSVRGNDRMEYAANHDPNWSESDPQTVGQAIAEASEEVLAIDLRSISECSWEDNDGQFNVSVVVQIVPIDWSKVRRRLEDRLRKDDAALRVAVAALDIPLY
jgi:phosphoribosyl-ATP pyrophosphohydrolase